jgi:ABC-type transport system involved in cytochrome bd biosynthesis fused ATPase/permease subunit
LKGGIHVEALIFSILWIALAVVGASLFDWRAGLLLSVGLFLLIMPTSALVLTKTGNFAKERSLRWGILTLSALALLIAWGWN